LGVIALHDLVADDTLDGVDVFERAQQPEVGDRFTELFQNYAADRLRAVLAQFDPTAEGKIITARRGRGIDILRDENLILVAKDADYNGADLIHRGRRSMLRVGFAFAQRIIDVFLSENAPGRTPFQAQGVGRAKIDQAEQFRVRWERAVGMVEAII